MTKTRTLTVAAALVLGVTAVAFTAPGDSGQFGSVSGQYEVDRCIVSAIQDIDFPAEDAGLLVQLDVVQGDKVSQGDSLGQIDDTEAQSQKAIAAHKAASAKEQAESMIPIDYAKLAAGVAEAHFRIGEDSNRARKGTISAMEMRRRQLDWDRAEAQVKQEYLNKELSKYDLSSATVEEELATKAIARRQLNAPFNGEVVQIYRHASEWLQQGEPILRFMRRDQMRVRGSIDATKFNPEDVQNCRVTVEYIRAGGQPVSFQGEVRFVSPIIDAINNEFAVEAVVENRQEGDNWLLPHGARVKMTIQVD